MSKSQDASPQATFQQVEALVRQYAAAEAALRAITADEVDAVIDPVSATPFLLHHAQAALAATEARYQRLLGRMAALVFELNSAGETVFVSESILPTIGYSADELLGRSWWATLCPGPQQSQVEQLYHYLNTGDVSGYTIEITAKGGAAIALELTTANYYEDDGSLQSVLAFCIDVSTRTHAEQALYDSEARYRTLSALTSDFVYAMSLHPDQSPTTEWATEAFTRITGYTLSELQHRGDWQGLIHPDDLPIAYRRVQRLLAGETDVSEFRIVTRAGEVRWVRDYTRPEHATTGGQIVRVLGAVQDITERRKTEELLQRSQERFAGIVNVADDAIITLDPQQHITFFNQGAERVFGYIAHEALGQSIDLLLPARLVEIHRRHVEAFARTSSGARLMGGRRELVGQRKDGSEFPLEASIAHFNIGKPSAEPGQAEQVLAVVLRDMTDHKQAEEALHRANADLLASVTELEQRNREMAALSEMGDILQICNSVEEAYAVIARFARRLFPDEAGALCIMRNSPNLVESVVVWGDPAPEATVFAADDCWSLRRGRVHLVTHPLSDLPCAHVCYPPAIGSLCVPMMAQGEALGILHFQHTAQAVQGPDNVRQRMTDSKRRLAMAMAEHIALALSNLKLRETLRNQAIRDPLTGLYNRRYMEESLERELRRASRSRYPIGVMMIDIDLFKRFNDTFGHEAGDTLLREVGIFLQSAIRAEDIACRYGGEEFVLIMPEASEEVTRMRAETIRKAIKRLHVNHLNQHIGAITVSIGVAAIPDHEMNVTAAIRRADAALYRAKHEGRDRVMVDK